MSILKLTQQVKTSIANNNTQQAISSLNEILIDHPMHSALIITAAQQHELFKDIFHGIISWEQSNLKQNQVNNTVLKLADLVIGEELKNIRIFINYNRESNCQVLASKIRNKLKADGFQIFMDGEDTPIGTDWAKAILHEINICHYYILLLSTNTNYSEMVIKTIEEANQRKFNSGYPIILPVRINFPIEQGMNTRLHSMLQQVQHLEWNSEKDTQKVLSKISDVLYNRVDLLSGQEENEKQIKQLDLPYNEAPIPLAPLEIPRGAVRLSSKYYIQRPQEEVFINYVETPGALLRIRGPRQFGKTSLLTRVIAHAIQKEYAIIAIDFQELEESILSNLDQLLWEFCSYFAEEFGLEDELNKAWSKPRAKKQISTAFIERQILRVLDKPILLALDEADRLFPYKDVSTEFFLLLRSWHEKSKVPNKLDWEKFRLVLSYSTEAKLAIQDLNASPFNVGEEAKLPPFSSTQILELAQRHGLEWSIGNQEGIMNLLAGHPYLTRRALYLIAKGEYSYSALMQDANKHNGPFSDHLRHHLVNLNQFEDAVSAMKNIMDTGRCNDPIMFTRLEATGLIIGSPPNAIPANQLYANYFKGKL